MASNNHNVNMDSTFVCVYINYYYNNNFALINLLL